VDGWTPGYIAEEFEMNTVIHALLST